MATDTDSVLTQQRVAARLGALVRLVHAVGPVRGAAPSLAPSLRPERDGPRRAEAGRAGVGENRDRARQPGRQPGRAAGRSIQTHGGRGARRAPAAACASSTYLGPPGSGPPGLLTTRPLAARPPIPPPMLHSHYQLHHHSLRAAPHRAALRGRCTPVRGTPPRGDGALSGAESVIGRAWPSLAERLRPRPPRWSGRRSSRGRTGQVFLTDFTRTSYSISFFVKEKESIGQKKLKTTEKEG